MAVISELSLNPLLTNNYHFLTVPLISTGSGGVQWEQISFGLSCSWGLDVGETDKFSCEKYYVLSM